jgi:hypothetical protein
MNWIEKFNRLPDFVFPTLIFTILFIIGFNNFKDYGISWDEPAQRLIGEISYNYLFNDDHTLNTFHDADYGVGIELPLFMLEKALNLQDSMEIYQMRHLGSHLFFLVCLLCGYQLIFKLFKNRWLALAGVLFFVLNPLIYAHSFFNTKDIPFMAMFLVCFLFIYKAFQSYRLSAFLFAGMASGLLMNLRIMGVMLVLFVIGFIIVDLVVNWEEKHFKSKAIKSLLVFILAFLSTLYLSWPYLYEHPIEHLTKAFSNMSKFRWSRDVLYFGELIEATKLPWHYGVVWFAITTPLVYLVLGFAGFLTITFKLIAKPFGVFKNGEERHLLIYVLCFIVPLIAVIVFKSVLYDGWRHLYFIYPPFVLLAVYSLHKIIQSRFRWVGTGVIILAFATSGWFMFRYHPNQHVFFNAIVNRGESEHIRHQFELDYWGVSYLQGIKAVLELDDSPVIEIQMANAPGVYNLDMLSKNDRARINLNYENPRYLITEYRWHPEDYPYSAEQEVFSVVVENNTILSVFKLRD